jgi:hypothetical protein
LTKHKKRKVHAAGKKDAGGDEKLVIFFTWPYVMLGSNSNYYIYIYIYDNPGPGSSQTASVLNKAFSKSLGGQLNGITVHSLFDYLWQGIYVLIGTCR